MKIGLVVCIIFALISVSHTQRVDISKMIKSESNITEESSKLSELKDTDIFVFIRRLIFSLDRQMVYGFTQAFEQTTEDLPDKCMDDDFQEDFVNTLGTLFSDIFSGRIFDIVAIYKNILAFVSQIGNELINACHCGKIFPELPYNRLIKPRQMTNFFFQTLKG